MAKTKKNEEIEEMNTNEEIKVEENIDVVVEKEQKTDKKINVIKGKILEKPKNDELIQCKSCVLGELYYISSKTGTTVIWNDINAEEYVEFSELVTMKSSQSRFLTEPWIMVNDDRAIKHLGLEPLYSKIANFDKISDFFKLPLEDMREKLKAFPSGIRKLFGEKAREMIQTEELHDTRVIKLLEEELQIELIKIEE